MAEALAIIGLVSAIVQFVDFSAKVVARLHEAQDEIRHGPKVFLDVRHRLPLMVDLLRRTQVQLEAGEVGKEARDTMLPVLQNCLAQVKILDHHIAKAIPKKGDSQWARGKKALLSVIQESELKRIDEVLKTSFDLMVQAGTFHTLTRIESREKSRENSVTSMANSFNVTVPIGQSLSDMSLSQSPPPAYDAGLQMSVMEKAAEFKKSAPVFMPPFQRDPKFLKRSGVMDDIVSKFKSQRQVALAGLGGVGKTQIAIEYAYIFKEDHPNAHVFWIYAGTAARFEQGYQDIARRLALPGWDDDQVDTLKLVHEWLSHDCDMKWLLLIDNADDSSVFYQDKSFGVPKTQEKAMFMARYLPVNPKGSILVTTRDKRVGERLGGREKPIEVETLSGDDSLALLRSKMPDDDCEDPDALKLVEELSYLPLAITQAAAFMSENCITVSEYLDLLASGDSDLAELLSEHMEDPRREMDTENSVVRTWKLSFDQISHTKPRAAEILSLLSVLDHHGAPRDLLRLPSESELAFRTALGVLQAFSLITTGKGKGAACRMHRLVSLSTQKWLEITGKLPELQSKALAALAERFPFRPNYDDWALLESLTPHAELLYSYPFTASADLLQCATILASSSLYDLGRGKYPEADAKCVRSLSLRWSLLSPDHILTLETMQILGETLLHESKFVEAREMLERTLEGREKVLGALHADTLETVSDLTNTLLELDELDKAEKFGKRALQGREETMGPDHYEVFVSLNILAMLLVQQGKLSEAKTTCMRALEGREKLLGYEHPDTLMALNNMGVVLYREGNYSEAKNAFEKVVEGEERLIGSECYDVQVSLSNMGDVHVALGELDEAEKCHRRVLTMREKVLGKEHPSTSWSVGKLAEVLRLKGGFCLPEAEELKNRADKGRGKAGALTTAGLLFD